MASAWHGFTPAAQPSMSREREVRRTSIHCHQTSAYGTIALKTIVTHTVCPDLRRRTISALSVDTARVETWGTAVGFCTYENHNAQSDTPVHVSPLPVKPELQAHVAPLSGARRSIHLASAWHVVVAQPSISVASWCEWLQHTQTGTHCSVADEPSITQTDGPCQRRTAISTSGVGVARIQPHRTSIRVWKPQQKVS